MPRHACFPRIEVLRIPQRLLLSSSSTMAGLPNGYRSFLRRLLVMHLLYPVWWIQVDTMTGTIWEQGLSTKVLLSSQLGSI
jgi:hypothetical protein